MPPDNLDDIFLGPDDEVPPNRARKTTRQRVERLQPLPGAYVRIPMQWLLKPVKEHVFEPEARLFLYVLYRSHWGQRGVKLTDAVAAEVGVLSSTKHNVIKRLESKGWARVERHPGHGSPTVWPVVLST